MANDTSMTFEKYEYHSASGKIIVHCQQTEQLQQLRRGPYLVSLLPTLNMYLPTGILPKTDFSFAYQKANPSPKSLEL